MPLIIQENVPLAGFTVYKIGGPARFFVEVKSADEMKEAIQWAGEKNAPFFILGAGSNILVSDKGFPGLVIRITGGNVVAEGETLRVDAGVIMARAVLESAKAGLSGFEWGIGVPGTVGGAIRGNAGCFGGEMSRALENVRVLKVKSQRHALSLSNGSKFKITSQNSKPLPSVILSDSEESRDPSVAPPSAGPLQDDTRIELLELNNSECQFGYRDSIFKKHPEWIILSAILRLKKGNPAEIQKTIRRIGAERTEKQDIGTKSCGCIFKNPSWDRKDIKKKTLLERFPELKQFKDSPSIPASFLIDRADLKGKRIGAAAVSPKHANFFVNEGGATAEEVVILIALVKDAVRKKFGIILEEEIQYVGF